MGSQAGWSGALVFGLGGFELKGKYVTKTTQSHTKS